jgi:hypothetical protein
MNYGVLQSKISILRWHQILYTNGSTDRSKLLNIFLRQILWDIKFHFFFIFVVNFIFFKRSCLILKKWSLMFIFFKKKLES